MLWVVVVPAAAGVWWYTGDWVAGVAVYGALAATWAGLCSDVATAAAVQALSERLREPRRGRVDTWEG